MRATLRSRAASLLVIDCGYFPKGRKSPEVALPRGIAPARRHDPVTIRRVVRMNGLTKTGAQRALGAWTKRTLSRFHTPLVFVHNSENSNRSSVPASACA